MNILKKRRLARERQHIEEMKKQKFYMGKNLDISKGRGCLNVFCAYCKHYQPVCKRLLKRLWEPLCWVDGKPIRYDPVEGITLDDIGKAGYDVNVMNRILQGGKVVKPHRQKIEKVDPPGKKNALTSLGKHKDSFLDSIKDK